MTADRSKYYHGLVDMGRSVGGHVFFRGVSVCLWSQCSYGQIMDREHCRWSEYIECLHTDRILVMAYAFP